MPENGLTSASANIASSGLDGVATVPEEVIGPLPPALPSELSLADQWDDEDGPPGVPSRTAWMVIVATLITLVLLYEYINWQPITPGRPAYQGHGIAHMAF